MMTNDLAVTSFDYSILTVEDADIVRAAATVIRSRLRRTSEDMLEIGRQLVAAKTALPHGAWSEWLETECDLSERTAQNFLRAASTFAESAIISDLAPTSVTRLAAAPPAAREAVLRRLEAGERVTGAEIDRIARASRPETAPSPTRPLSADLASELAPLWRERIATLADDIVALAEKIAQRAASPERITKKWLCEQSSEAYRLLEEISRLTGQYSGVSRPEKWMSGRLESVGGRIGDILGALQAVQMPGIAPPTNALLRGWLDKFAVGGVVIELGVERTPDGGL